MKMTEILRSDLPASFVVFLIALPLSLGIALATGAPMKSGIIAAVVGGIVVGILTGAPLQVSGPAAGLSVMLFGYIQKFGFETVCLITIFAGIFQIILGYLGIAQLAFIISPPVIHAMLAGIGILISLGQIHVIFGFTPKGSALANIIAIPESFQNSDLTVAGLGVFTLAVLLIWNNSIGKKNKIIPASLIAVILGTLASYWLNAIVPKVQLTSGLFDNFSLPKIEGQSVFDLMIAGIGLTLVASCESLLCAVATDKLHSGPRVNLSRELIAQGVGNFVSGFLGGLPLTGVIVRSSANISAGAQTKYSAILHGVWILLFCIFLTPVLELIPLSVLAALLIFTGVKLVKLQEIKKLMKFNESIIYFATLFGVVFIDLLSGIALGFGFALILLLIRMNSFFIDRRSEKNSENIYISGNLTFLGVPRLIQKLNAIPKGKTLIIHFNIEQLDYSAIEAIRSWRESYEKQGGKIIKVSLDTLWKDLSSPMHESLIKNTKPSRWISSPTLSEKKL
jgi:carbonic anhydrase